MNSRLYNGWIAIDGFAPRRHEFRYRISPAALDLDEQDAVLEVVTAVGQPPFLAVLFAKAATSRPSASGMRLIDAVREQVRLAGWSCATRAGCAC